MPEFSKPRDLPAKVSVTARNLMLISGVGQTLEPTGVWDDR